MSNIIPFVSSSPPPIDDDQSFGWDDGDDDDFGNFASAPSFAPSTRDDSNLEKDNSSTDWSATGFTSDASGERDSSPEYQVQTIEDESVSSDLKESAGNGNSSSTSQEVEQTDKDIGVEAGSDDDFADFAAFQDDLDKKGKPYINSLPLESVHHQSESDNGVRKMADTVMEKSRESIATDSGLFSTDMSPLPQSESLCISEGDKTMQSDDETFSDMPQDSQSAAISNQVTKQVEFDEDETMEHEKSQSSFDNKPGSQSEGTPLSDQCEQNTLDSEVLESGIENNLNKGDNSDRSLKENELSSLSSSALNSEGLEYSEQHAVSNIQDIADTSSPIHPPDVSTEDAENTNDSVSEKMSDVSNEDDTDKDEANWATFETITSPSFHSQYENDANGLKEEPEDLVLRKDSINLDDEEEGVSGASSEAASATNEKSLEDSVECIGEEGETECAISEISKDENDGHTALQENGMNSSQSNADLSQPSDLHNEMDDDLGEFSAAASSIDSSTITENQQDQQGFAVAQNADSETVDEDFADFDQAQTVSGSEDRTSGCEENEDFADFSSGTQQAKRDYDSLNVSSSKEVASKWDNKDDDDGFADFNSPSVSSDSQQEVTSMFSSKESGSKEDNDNADDFGDFNHMPVSSDAQCNHATLSSKYLASKEDDDEDFGDFNSPSVSSDTQCDVSPSKQSTSKWDDDDDDFGDFNSPSDVQVTTSGTDDFGDFSTKTSDVQADTDEFGDFSTKTAGSGGEADDFGDFGGQPTPSSDSGWADFAEPAKPAATAAAADDDDDFGNFASTDSATTPQPNKTSSANTTPVNESATVPALGSTSRDPKEEKLETALKNCFPCQQTVNNEAMLDNKADVVSSDRKKLGVLETILQYGLQYQSACTQTWQVVQHPSKKDPRVKLWGHLHDTDGSPAVVYQWSKSNTNSHLFHTLRIDTQNMLIGHKKRSVPIFATGLSLLEPIRGGRNERERGANSLPTQKAAASILQPALVDTNQQEQNQQPGQDIPAVDFDWSTSGLTNPLTSHSLDLDFLVAHDSHASDKPSVFESELLDAPRSNVKSSQPLEDILKSVKPTSVRSRRDDAATSQMSSEALKILSSLPDLTFMQSKVLMFPIKN